MALRVRDRVSGRMRQDAVVIPTVAGAQYVVSMFGTISHWVRNLDDFAAIAAQYPVYRIEAETREGS